MKVEFDVDEVWNLFSHVVKQVMESASLGDEDRAAIARWRSTEMRQGSEEMRVLAQKVNNDLAAALRKQERSPVRKPDWV